MEAEARYFASPDSAFKRKIYNPSLSQLTPSASIAEVTFDVRLESTSSERIKQTLTHHGICVLNHFLPRQSAHKAAQEMQAYFASEQFSAPRESQIKEYGEEEHYIWQTDYAWSDHYLEVANAKKTVINIRARNSQSDDAGMVDIFDIERLTQAVHLSQTQLCLDTMHNAKWSSLLSQHSGYARRQSNLYHNRGVQKTRGPHIDNNSDPYKLFLYLSDVNEEKNGPYCYLPGSANKRHWMTKERLKNAYENRPSTEASSVSRNTMLPIYGSAGTAIITNQSGIHCGWPQHENGERLMLVSNYY